MRLQEAEERGGSLHESITHECLKSLLAFRKPAVAVASRRPARADGPKVGLEEASAPGELRGALGRLGYLCAEGGKAKFVAAADLFMLLGPS